MVAAPLPIGLRSPSLRARVEGLTREYAARWAATAMELPVFGPSIGLRGRFSNARATTRLIDELFREIERLPDDERARSAWRESVRVRLQRFGAERLGWPAGYRRLLFADDFFASSVAFARQARAFDPELSLEDLWQAMRNVWIGNSLQMLLDRPLTLGPGLFAYSMLYPLSDNLLDDPQVPASAKRAFNERFRRRLAGLQVSPPTAREAAICRLVARIEEEFPRLHFADVYQSLLAIHAGQARSLSQQHQPQLADAEIVDISCEKGGASVLADLYLLTGRATAEQERFAFGYGVFLQLLDDLQDVERDLAAGHQTLFTRAARRGPLDGPTARLARFIDCVLDEAGPFAGDAFADRMDLVRRNCRSLLVGAVAEQPRRFSPGFRRALARQWPFSLRAMRRLRRRAQRRYAGAASVLQRRTGAPSLLDLLLSRPP